MFLISEKSPFLFAPVPIGRNERIQVYKKISIMSLRDLLESGANVSVTVTLDDLRAIFNEAAKGGRIFGALRNRDQRPRTGPGNADEIE